MSALSDRIARLVADAIAGEDVYCELQDVIREVDALCAPVGVEGVAVELEYFADCPSRVLTLAGKLRALAQRAIRSTRGREGMSGHTPGPWSVGAEDADSGQIEVISEARPYVCMVLPGAIDGTTAANARLIAAAPELLEVLQRMLACPAMDHCLFPVEDAEAVIAKATGAQP